MTFENIYIDKEQIYYELSITLYHSCGKELRPHYSSLYTGCPK